MVIVQEDRRQLIFLMQLRVAIPSKSDKTRISLFMLLNPSFVVELVQYKLL